MTTENPTPPEDPNYQAPGDEQDGGSDQQSLVRVDQSGLASIARSEAMAQVDVAHAYPRDIKRFEAKATEMATFDLETAKLCMFTLERTEYDKVLKKRVKKDIVGPSIRLAEIVAHTYQNIHVGSRPIEVGDITVTSQGVAWDLENNSRVTVEVSRGITGYKGKRYGNDMIVLTLNAAAAIARRNAIFSVVPRVYINRIFDAVKRVATGGGKPIQEKRELLVGAFARLGVDIARVLARVERASVDDLSLQDIEILIGLGTRVKQGEAVNDIFPLPQPQTTGTPPVPGADQEGQKVDLGKKEPAASTEEAKQEPATTPAPAEQPTPASSSAPPAAEKPAAKPKKNAGGAAELSFTLKDPDRAAGEPTPEELEKMGPLPPAKKNDDGTGIS